MSLNAYPITISLPKHMITRARKIAKARHQTLSAYVRDILFEQTMHRTAEGYYQLNEGKEVDWDQIEKTLKELSKKGNTNICLSEFVIQDRHRH